MPPTLVAITRYQYQSAGTPKAELWVYQRVGILGLGIPGMGYAKPTHLHPRDIPSCYLLASVYMGSQD